MRPLLVTLAVTFAACAPGPAGADAIADSAIASTGWQTVTSQPLPATGPSAPVAVSAALGDRSVLVRALVSPPLAQTEVCVQLTDFRTATGLAWSGGDAACAGCAQSPGYGFAQALWAAADLPGDGLRLRVQLVTCATGEPVDGGAFGLGAGHTFTVQTWHAPTLPPGKGTLHVAFASVGGGAAATPGPGWQAPAAVALATLRATGLGVSERAPLTLPAGSVAAPLLLGNGHADRELALENAVVAALHAAGSAVNADLDVVVVTVPCLDWVGKDGQVQRLLGHSTRMPGGPRGAGGASLVVVGTVDCKPPAASDAVRLGNVMAHEIGHYLGLGHDAAQPPTLMTADIADRGNAPLAFSPDQAARVRLSPVVVAP